MCVDVCGGLEGRVCNVVSDVGGQASSAFVYSVCANTGEVWYAGCFVVFVEFGLLYCDDVNVLVCGDLCEFVEGCVYAVNVDL